MCWSRVVLPVRGGATIKPALAFANGSNQVDDACRVAIRIGFESDTLVWD